MSDTTITGIMAAARRAIGIEPGARAQPDCLLWLAGVRWAAGWVNDETQPLFPDQECPACGLEHPGQPCPQPDLFEECHEQAS